MFKLILHLILKSIWMIGWLTLTSQGSANPFVLHHNSHTLNHSSHQHNRHSFCIKRNRTMYLPQNNFDFEEPDPRLRKFKSLRTDVELLNLKSILLKINAFDVPEVQKHFRTAKLGTDKGQERELVWLNEYIQKYKELAMQENDPFMPYATNDQISNSRNGIHICNQVHNNIPLYTSPDAFLLGALLLGRQAGGKSTAAYNILKQISVPFILLDPKCSWIARSSLLNADYIHWDYASFDLRPPPDSNITLDDWLFVVMESLCQVAGLQFALDPLVEAGQIAQRQRLEYIERTGEDTPLCLKDIKIALDLCNSSNYKRKDYITSAKTALSLIVGSDSQSIFATRSGLSLDHLSKGRYIIGCPFLNTFQARYLGVYLLLYKRYACQLLPETTHLRDLIVIDDSSRFLSRVDSIWGSGSKFGAWMHLLSVLRSSGCGTLFIDQLVEPISDDIKQLCNFWLIVGGMRGTNNHREIASAMNLNSSQAEYIGQMKTQECLCYCPTHINYPHTIHGYIPTINE